MVTAGIKKISANIIGSTRRFTGMKTNTATFGKNRGRQAQSSTSPLKSAGSPGGIFQDHPFPSQVLRCSFVNMLYKAYLYPPYIHPHCLHPDCTLA